VVAVVMAVHDGAATVLGAIESVRAQTYARWEMVVIDDGSGDATPAILAEAAARDPRITVLRNPRRMGLPASLNRGWRHLPHPLVARMDADDHSYPDRFARQVEFMASHPEVQVLGTAAELCDEDGEPLSTVSLPAEHDRLHARRYANTPVFHPSVMVRREVLERLGGYDERLLRAQDVDLWLRAFAAGVRFANLSEPLIRYRTRRRPTLRTTLRLALVLARGARREGRTFTLGWYALRHLLLGVAVRSGLYVPATLRRGRATGR
jgi:glycosyltransferase involved in cell wall biosynthesis